MPLWGNNDDVASKPRYANTNNSSLYGNTYGVSVAEVQAANTLVKGIHPGWVSVKAYTDNHGNARYKAETLVAMGSISGDAVANDDLLFSE